jgi:hypothetical protein
VARVSNENETGALQIKFEWEWQVNEDGSRCEGEVRWICNRAGHRARESNRNLQSPEERPFKTEMRKRGYAGAKGIETKARIDTVGEVI